jgi:cation diffusion facilitator family transporter
MYLRPDDPGVRANVLGLAANILLMVLKFVYGALAGSEALRADGFNSAGDILATSIAFTAYLYAKKPADADHHYGHGNAENVAGLIIGGMLFATGIFITIQSILVLIDGAYQSPLMPAVYVALLTIIIKEALYHYASWAGKKVKSAALLASAKDHRADVFVAFVVLVGIVAARTSWQWLDPLSAVLVGLYIAWMAADPILSNMHILMDRAPIELRGVIRTEVLAVPEVHAVRDIRVHPVGCDLHVDLEIGLDEKLTLHDAHEKAHVVEERLKSRIEDVVEVSVHVNPVTIRGQAEGPPTKV